MIDEKKDIYPNEQLEYEKYYHIYNCGINGCNLFNETDNYPYFLDLYNKYISPIADTYAWVLMPNHFHLLVRMKKEADIRASFSNFAAISNPTGLKSPSNKPLYQYFSNLFNAYSKAFNKRYDRHGALFERAFKRKLIEDKTYLKNTLIYIHNNPVHHGFTNTAEGYPWSSYLSCVSIKPTKLKRENVMGWFDNEANFKYYHEKKLNVKKIEEWLGM
ncbi:MAG: transposase [Paludibacteraceae bacterium]